MDYGLTGKRVLVSGSTAGIGLASATLLATEGAQVWVNGRTEARVEAAIAAIRRTTANGAVEGLRQTSARPPAVTP